MGKTFSKSKKLQQNVAAKIAKYNGPARENLANGVVGSIVAISLQAAQNASTPPPNSASQHQISTTGSDATRAVQPDSAEAEQIEANRKKAAEDEAKRAKEEEKAEEYAELVRKMSKMELENVKEALTKHDAPEDIKKSAQISDDWEMLKADPEAAERLLKEFAVDSDDEKKEDDDKQKQEDVDEKQQEKKNKIQQKFKENYVPKRVTQLESDTGQQDLTLDEAQDEAYEEDLGRLVNVEKDWSGDYFGKGKIMDFGMSCEELTEDVSSKFSQFTEEFFRKVGLDNVLSRGENCDKQKLFEVTNKIIKNIEEAIECIIDQTLADQEKDLTKVIVSSKYSGKPFPHGPIHDELERVQKLSGTKFELKDKTDRIKEVLERAKDSLNMTLALILYCRWKLLRDNQSQEQSEEWLQTYLFDPFIEKFKTEADKDTLFMLRKLVFKAAIICEGTKYCFNYAIQARDHQLDILDKQDDQNQGEEEKFDIQRSIPIVKMFLKKIKGATAEQEVAVPPASLHDKLSEVVTDFTSWVGSLDEAIQEIFQEFGQQLHESYYERAVLTAIQKLIKVFMTVGENERGDSFNSIAKILVFYDTWQHEFGKGFDESTFDNVISPLSIEEKKDLFVKSVKYLKQVQNIKTTTTKGLIKQVVILRALPYLLKLLSKCMSVDQEVQQKQDLRDVLAELKKIVQAKKIQQETINANNESSREVDDAITEDQEASKYDWGKPLVPDKMRADEQEAQKQERLKEMKENDQAVKQVHDLLREVEELKQNHDRDSTGYGTSSARNEEVKNLIEEAKQQVVTAILHAEKTREKYKQKWESLQFTNPAKLAANGAKSESRDSLKKANSDFMTAKVSIAASRDMKIYYLQQIWLTNYPQIFDFYADIAGPEDEVLSTIWEMPKEPDSEIQELDMEDELMEYLKARSNKKENSEGHERYNVYATMLLKMSEALMSKQLTKLEFVNQNFVVKIFVAFIGKHMEDFRLTNDRSSLVQNTISKRAQEQDMKDNQATSSDSDNKKTEKLRLMYQIVLFFLRQYLYWHNNTERMVSDTNQGNEEMLKMLKMCQETKKNLMKDNSDLFFQMIFDLQDQKKKEGQQEERQTILMPRVIEEQNKFMDNPREINSMIFLQTIQYFFQEDQMIELLSNKKNLSKMLENLRDNLSKKENALILEQPFRSYGLKIVYQMLSRFCKELKDLLLAQQSKDPDKVKEFKPLFVGTWLIMLQIYIMRTKQQVNEQFSAEYGDDQDEEAYTPDKLFNDLLLFWRDTRDIKPKDIERIQDREDQKLKMRQQRALNKELLTPNFAQVLSLQTDQIPALIKVTAKEAKLEEHKKEEKRKYLVLDNLLKFLILYSSLVFNEVSKTELRKLQNSKARQDRIDENIKAQRHSKKMINLLPILTQIAEKNLLKNCKVYKKQAEQYNNYLPACQYVNNKEYKCPTCIYEHEREESFLINKVDQAVISIRGNKEDKGTSLLTEKELTSDSVLSTQNKESTYLTSQLKISQFTGYQTVTNVPTTNGRGTGRGTKQYDNNANVRAPRQLVQYIHDSWTNFAEIERRIFLKYSSRKKTIKLLKQAVEDERPQGKTDEKIDLQQEWKKREDQWQEIASNMDLVKEKDTEDLWMKLKQLAGLPNKKEIKQQVKLRMLAQWKAQKELDAYIKTLKYDIDENDKKYDEEEAKKVRSRKPMNEFYDAYSAYMLLKVKIKHQIFQTAEEMLEATNECIRKYNNVRSMVPSEHRQFMTTEKAFVLKETIDAIEELVLQNQENSHWLEKFLPKNSKLIKTRMQLLVKQLGFAGFPFQAVEVQQNQIEKIINNDKVFQEKDLQIRQDQSKNEKSETEQLLKGLKRLYKQIITHVEGDDCVTNPGYCDYMHVQFYGKMFPEELTHHNQGFLIRVNYTLDLPTITEWLRNIFSNELYIYNKRTNPKPQKMKVVGRTSPSVDAIPGEILTHWQEHPVIAVVFDIKRLNEDVQKTYFSIQEQLDFNNQIEKQYKVRDDQMNRDNYKKQYEQNFTNCYYQEIREKNKLLQRDYYLKVNNDIRNVAAENREKAAAAVEVQEHQESPYDQATTEKLCKKYFETDPTPKLAEIVEVYIQDNPCGFFVFRQKQQKEIEKKVKENVEKMLDQYMIKNFAQSDEKIADRQDYITDTQFEQFEPKYKVMTGMQDDRPVTKLWRDIKVMKVESVVAKNSRAEKWSFLIEQRYKRIVDQRAKAWYKVEVQYVIDFVNKFIDRITFYHDSNLNIFILPLKFPTGFMCQQIDEVVPKVTNGAKKTNLDIKQSITHELESAQVAFKSVSKDAKVIAFDPSKAEKSRAEKFEILKTSVIDYLKKIHYVVISDVAGGIRQYLDLFFSKGCIHSLNANNQQYLDLLIVFKTIEELVETIRDCLDDVEKLIAECRKKITDKTTPSDVYDQIQIWLDKIEQRVQDYQVKVDELATEVQETREQTDMDTLLADERDEIDSDDSDWS